MSDPLTPEQRHHCMASIHGKDTKPEIVVRKYLWHNGFRYRLNHPRLPGKPDVVLRKYRTCIFINGCFWHGHEGCKSFVMPRTNVDFWKSKIDRNRRRDIEVQLKLAEMGWHRITIWECQLKKDMREETLKGLVYTLDCIFLNDHKPKSYSVLTELLPMAAEEQAPYGKR